MRWKMTAGVLMALAFLIPAAPAVAQAGPTGPNQACQTGERKVYTDIRTLVTIDLDTATDTQVRVLGVQMLSAAEADSLPELPDVVQQRLDGTVGDLRAFLKGDWQTTWSRDLRVSIGQTLTGGGAHVQAAAQKVLGTGSIDAYLAYLNDGLYVARALDCASQPTTSPTVKPSATPTPSATTTVAPVPTPSAGAGGSGGQGGGLPVTGTDTGLVAAIGGALLLLGGAVFVIGRRRRSRFVA